MTRLAMVMRESLSNLHPENDMVSLLICSRVLGGVRLAVGAGLLVCCAALPLGAQIPEFYKAKDEQLPASVEPQPIPFSHKQHVAAGLSCKDCHAGAAKRERAGLPQTDQCMLCHRAIATESPAVQRLAEFHQRGDTVKWVRIYQVPDFVFFSHAHHLKAAEECTTCHGPVAQREVLAKEVSTGMVRCMNCHTERGVSNDCVFCHQLGQ